MNEIVARQTLSLSSYHLNGMGDDWTQAEIAILERTDIKVREMRLYLPDRSWHAIYVKRSRLGISRAYRSRAKARALKQSQKAEMNRRLSRLTHHGEAKPRAIGGQ